MRCLNRTLILESRTQTVTYWPMGHLNIDWPMGHVDSDWPMGRVHGEERNSRGS